MPPDAQTPTSPEWAALFYLCGHYNRPGEKDAFVAALQELTETGGSPAMSVAAYLDLESGAQRIALRHGEHSEPEFLGTVNSGDPETLEQFLLWAFDTCPAKRYVLVMAGLGIMDTDSVVGRPPFDAARLFAICDDRATNDAIELHELSATLKSAFPPDGARRLVMLACDMYAMQFMEVAYELRGLLDLLVGIQPGASEADGPLRHWPYAQLLQRWHQVVAAPAESATPAWNSPINPQGVMLAQETVALLGQHYGATEAKHSALTVSAINLEALVPLAQALDTFSVVFLQWLSNEVVWRARERVVFDHTAVLTQSLSYDLDELATSIATALYDSADEALVRWAADAIPIIPYPSLSRTLRVMGSTARSLAKPGEAGDVHRQLADEMSAVRARLERLLAVAVDQEPETKVPDHSDVDRAVRGLFTDPAKPNSVREPAAWGAIIERSRERFVGPQARELTDAFNGIAAANQLACLAMRVSVLARGVNQDPQNTAVIAVQPPGGHCGLGLYRPIELDKLAESNYLELRFSKELHWTALLTAVDLIKEHARMLWRLLESQLTAAPLEARYQLMRRLAGDRALTGRHAAQLRALSAPNALFLTIDPRNGDAAPDDERREAKDKNADDPIVSYCVRLSSLDRSATVVEKRNQVTRARLDRLLAEIDKIGASVDAPPDKALQQLARCGSLLGDDILYGISEQLADVVPADDRAVHLVLQMPRELMRYPWELLRDRNGWLVERFAIGRQVIADAERAPRWSSSPRQGALRLLVVAPVVEDGGAELTGAGTLEGAHVADCFSRLLDRLPGMIDPTDFKAQVDRPVTVEEFRMLLRSQRYDIVHFAGHGRYDAENPDRSCWMFADGPLYAFELRQTLANAEVKPWLIYGSACEGAREGTTSRNYHDGVYGMATAALSQGVAAYVGPLWKISDTDAKNIAAAFYEALLIRRTSLGEALALARRSVREGVPDLDELMTRPPVGIGSGQDSIRSTGWAGMVLYGDPTPTILQRLSPPDAEEQDPTAPATSERARRRNAAESADR